MRDKLIEEMLKEVYGPRKGAEEEISGDPLKEYITGVIIPQRCRKVEENPDSEITISMGENFLADDDIIDNEFMVPTPSELDPKMRPRSFGVSFVVRGIKPSFRICVTWGRYVRDQGKDGKIWRRRPYYCITKQISVTEETKKFQLYERDDGKISLLIRKIQRNDEYSIIVVNMVNDLNIEKCHGKALTEASIFQPSIRIKLGNDTQLAPLPYHRKGGEILHFLYRKKPVLARGYMCSAIWKDIDYSNYIDGQVLWADGYHFDECRDFIAPDVSSEFVPLYPNPTPLFEWDDVYGESPELSAYKLSEMWKEDEIERYLAPLVVAYKRWIENGKGEIMDSAAKRTAEYLVKLQKVALNRLKDGIEILKRDTDARLSFCFANRAIWLQHRWKTGKEDFRWRPFQLAFILMNLEPIYNKDSAYRELIDLLWIPTGGGKTEAYLAIMAFTMALRRRKATNHKEGDTTGGGTAIITRYTLRLLTVQQFRRTLRMITAAEYLRVMRCKKGAGWRPEKCDIYDDWIYGSVRFSAGMWVGGAVSPNHLRKSTSESISAIDALMENNTGGEPAQVIRCPVCGAWLAIPDSGLPAGKNKLHLVVRCDKIKSEYSPHISEIEPIKEITITGGGLSPGYVTLTISLEADKKLTGQEIDDIGNKIKKLMSVEIAPFRASRPGYFGYGDEPGRRIKKPVDFMIYCPNPDCKLNKDISYEEGVPLNSQNIHSEIFPDGLVARRIETPFSPGSRIPIPAYTVDEQIYHRCPTVIISTADKIARLAFEPRASSIFGNVERYNAYYGYYRGNMLPEETTRAAGENEDYNVSVKPFYPPELIIQDELHLMNGPLGSMFGLYESAVEGLIKSIGGMPKYIASTATIKNAESQVKHLFARELFQFPPYGLDMSDSFFVKIPGWDEGWNENRPGRVYMGIYAPGMGPLTPIIRIWSRLLKTCHDCMYDSNIKYFWTIVGYFNAIRELGGGRALYREDIVERLGHISSGSPRMLDPDNVVELSSRVNSTDIPQILDELEKGGERKFDENPDAIFTTSMFGTGVNIPYLSLMVVNGQPKTTSQYIQATGRVGRAHGGLVITFLRAGRPRDLSHYEMFSAYHHRIYLEVEPSSVSPFSEGCLARASGPTMVSFLRNNPQLSAGWCGEDGMAILDENADKNVKQFMDKLSLRVQYIMKKPGNVADYFLSQKDRWLNIAMEIGRNSNLAFVEYPFRKPQKNVVLGDPFHEHDPSLKVVYKNAPQSLREVEETTGFEV